MSAHWPEAARRGAEEFQLKEVEPLKIGLAPSISVSLVLDPIAEITKFVPGLHVELRGLSRKAQRALA